VENSNPIIAKIWHLTSELINNDRTFELWRIKFKFDLEKKESEMSPLQFLKHVFGELEDLIEEN
jgi:hypothetical protein